MNPRYQHFDDIVSKKRRRFKNRSGAPLNGKVKGMKHLKHGSRLGRNFEISPQSPKMGKKSTPRCLRSARLATRNFAAASSVTTTPSSALECSVFEQTPEQKPVFKDSEHNMLIDVDLMLVGQRCTLHGIPIDEATVQYSLSECFSSVMDIDTDPLSCAKKDSGNNAIDYSPLKTEPLDFEDLNFATETFPENWF